MYMRKAASANTEAVRQISMQLRILIENCRYPPNLIFNVDKTGLFWK